MNHQDMSSHGLSDLDDLAIRLEDVLNTTAHDYFTNLLQNLSHVKMRPKRLDIGQLDTSAGILWVVLAPIAYFLAVGSILGILLLYYWYTDVPSTSDVTELSSIHRLRSDSRYNTNQAISALPGEFVRTYLTPTGTCLAMSRASGGSKGSVRSLGTLTDPEPPQSSTILRKLMRSQSEISIARQNRDRNERGYQDRSTRDYQDRSTKDSQERSTRDSQDRSTRGHQDRSTRDYQDINKREPDYEYPSFHEGASQARKTPCDNSALGSSLDISTDSLEETSAQKLGTTVAQHKLVWLASDQSESDSSGETNDAESERSSSSENLSGFYLKPEIQKSDFQNCCVHDKQGIHDVRDQLGIQDFSIHSGNGVPLRDMSESPWKRGRIENASDIPAHSSSHDLHMPEWPSTISKRGSHHAEGLGSISSTPCRPHQVQGDYVSSDEDIIRDKSRRDTPLVFKETAQEDVSCKSNSTVDTDEPQYEIRGHYEGQGESPIQGHYEGQGMYQGQGQYEGYIELYHSELGQDLLHHLTPHDAGSLDVTSVSRQNDHSSLMSGQSERSNDYADQSAADCSLDSSVLSLPSSISRFHASRSGFQATPIARYPFDLSHTDSSVADAINLVDANDITDDTSLRPNVGSSSHTTVLSATHPSTEGSLGLSTAGSPHQSATGSFWSSDRSVESDDVTETLTHIPKASHTSKNLGYNEKTTWQSPVLEPHSEQNESTSPLIAPTDDGKKRRRFSLHLLSRGRVTVEQRLKEFGFIKSNGKNKLVIDPSPGKFQARGGAVNCVYTDSEDGLHTNKEVIDSEDYVLFQSCLHGAAGEEGKGEMSRLTNQGNAFGGYDNENFQSSSPSFGLFNYTEITAEKEKKQEHPEVVRQDISYNHWKNLASHNGGDKNNNVLNGVIKSGLDGISRDDAVARYRDYVMNEQGHPAKPKTLDKILLHDPAATSPCTNDRCGSPWVRELYYSPDDEIDLEAGQKRDAVHIDAGRNTFLGRQTHDESAAQSAVDFLTHHHMGDIKLKGTLGKIHSNPKLYRYKSTFSLKDRDIARDRPKNPTGLGQCKDQPEQVENKSSGHFAGLTRFSDEVNTSSKMRLFGKNRMSTTDLFVGLSQPPVDYDSRDSDFFSKPHPSLMTPPTPDPREQKFPSLAPRFQFV